MLKLTCLCGRVELALAQRPDAVIECNCALCRKSGARWGYFHPSQVTVSGETKGYRREDKAEPGAEVHSCATCGATTHYLLTERTIAVHGNVQMGVNLRLAEERELAGIVLQFPDGAAWPGEGDFGFVRSACVLGEG